VFTLSKIRIIQGICNKLSLIVHTAAQSVTSRTLFFKTLIFSCLVFFDIPGYVFALCGYHIIDWWNKNGPKSYFMSLDETIKEMEGKISLLDNKQFIYYAGAIGIYYIAYLSFLTHIIIRSGGFH